MHISMPVFSIFHNLCGHASFCFRTLMRGAAGRKSNLVLRVLSRSRERTLGTRLEEERLL